MDKIKVNLSYYVYSTIYNDAENFGIIKNNQEPNINLFCNMIIKSLYQERFNKVEQTRNKFKNKLINYLPQEELDDVLNDISKTIAETYNDFSNQYHDYFIMIRPKKEYEYIFDTIIENHLRNDTISNYFRSLFVEYTSYSQEDRELLIFKDLYLTLNKAIKNHNIIKIKINNNYKIFKPYQVVNTKEKLYNFLIGLETTSNNKNRCLSLHLYKINQVLLTNDTFIFSNKEINALDQIILKGPQFSSSGFCECKVELTEKGLKKWKTIFMHRPIPTKIENNFIYFYSSCDQLFNYFSRFGKDVKIIYPDFLKKKIYLFHKEAL